MKKFIVILLMLICNVAISQTGWFQQNSGTTQSLETVHFINDQTGFAGGGFIIYKTTNGGTSWSPKVLPDTTIIYAIRFLNQQTGYACGGRVINNYTSYQYIFKTTNTGENWIKINTNTASMSQEYYYDIFPVENVVYAAHGGYSDFYGSLGNVLKSTNGGTTMTVMMNSMEFCFDNLSFLNSLTGWVAGRFFTDTQGGIKTVYRTNDGGINWTLQYEESAQYMGYSKIRIHFTNANKGFGLYSKQNKTRFIKTADGGLTWDTASYQHQCNLALFFADENTGWIGGGSYNDSIVILRSTNSGNNWHIQKKGYFNIKSIYSINNLTGWAVGGLGVIFKTTTGGVTSIEQISTELPSSFLLSQNYPNPFNPVTKIKFDIPRWRGEGGWTTTLRVYDVMGREVQTLVNERLQPGTYEASFDGSLLNSGVYFYKLTTDGFSETKRMLLIK